MEGRTGVPLDPGFERVVHGFQDLFVERSRFVQFYPLLACAFTEGKGCGWNV